MRSRFSLTFVAVALSFVCTDASRSAIAAELRAAAAEAGSDRGKGQLTPAFWQRDPQADFDDEGRMHCAPSAVADGLIYLSKAYGFTGLVAGTSHDDQIALVKELADDFETDPGIGGTNPDRILTGLLSYAESKGYELTRLELKSWRGVRAANKPYKTGTKPDMTWMQAAAADDRTIVLFNFGWYYEEADGYKRKGGHWVVVVGANGDGAFEVHNPALQPARQVRDTSIRLSRIDEDFPVTTDSGEADMQGYYEAEGPGLPHGEKVKAILDAVIAFSLKPGR